MYIFNFDTSKIAKNPSVCVYIYKLSILRFKFVVNYGEKDAKVGNRTACHGIKAFKGLSGENLRLK